MEDMGCWIGLLSSVFSDSMTSVVMLDVRSTEGSGQDILICCHGFGFSWIWVVWWCVGGVDVDVFCGWREVAVVGFFLILVGCDGVVVSVLGVWIMDCPFCCRGRCGWRFVL